MTAIGIATLTYDALWFPVLRRSDSVFTRRDADFTLILVASGSPTGDKCSSSLIVRGMVRHASVVLGFLVKFSVAGARAGVHKDLAVQRGRNE